MIPQNLSEKKMAVVTAYNKGYRVINGQVHYQGRIRKIEFKHKKNSGSPYASFGIRVESRKRVNVYVHHLVAYQKFGDKFLNADVEDMVVIHLDGNTTNNFEENIVLGNRGNVSSIRADDYYFLNKMKKNNNL